MLNRSPVANKTPDAPAAREEGIDLSQLVQAVTLIRRRWPSIVLFLVPALLLGLLYVVVTPATYLAKSSVLLDTHKLQINLYQSGSALGDTAIDYGAVDSQIELLRSDAIARSVVEDLDLTRDPEATGRNSRSFFAALSQAFWRWLDPDRGAVSADAVPASQQQLTAAAIGYVRGNISVQRVRQTYIVEIGFTARDPARAAQIANAVAEAYILDQTQSKQTTTKRATEWLQQRARELRDQAIEAERVLQDYKTKNKLASSGTGTAEEQQITELRSQLVSARSQAIDAKAKMDQLQEVIAAGRPDAILSDNIRNDVIGKLRQQYVDASRRLADYTVRFGAEHESVVNLRKDMQRIRTAAIEELKRVAEGMRADYEVAQAREKSLQTRLDAATREDATTRQGFGTLQALEGEARSYRSLYESFLQRYVEATQQQSIATTEARILTPASAGAKVWPLGSRVMLISGAAGLLLGYAFAYLRDRLDSAFRSSKQVESSLGVRCLGILPDVTRKHTPARPLAAENPDERFIREDLGIARQVMLTPFSRFTETVRSIKVAADVGSVGHDIRVIGMASALPGEGKSTVSSNLAQLVAHGGAKTLLIDADFRNPSLTRLLAPTFQDGLLEVLEGRVAIEEAVWRDPVTGLFFLPGADNRNVVHSSEILASKKMAQLVADLRECFDYLVIDLPPLAPVVDARAASHVVDGFVLVIEWGTTSPEVVHEALDSAEVLQSKLIGAVLNRANASALKRMESYKGNRYHRYYTHYATD